MIWVATLRIATEVIDVIPVRDLANKDRVADAMCAVYIISDVEHSIAVRVECSCPLPAETGG